MGLLEQLQEQGWYITQPGLDKLLESDKNGPATNPDVKQLVKLALNTDLREYGGGALSSLTARGTKVESFEGTGVVQIVKLRNLGAPKVNEDSKTAPRLLKLTVTDGQTQYVALEHEPIPALSLNTPPGTKILLKSGPIRIAQGVMMLSDKNVSVLGGHVTALVEKWELSRTMAKYAKGGRLQFSASGPPPWIPFGQKIQQPTAVNSDKDFKSLQTKEKEDSKENSEFNALRNDAIAEATKLGTKKTFGGGAKQMVDANVQKIMDRGFTEEQANHALKLTRNNVDRALSNLQRIEGRKQAQADAGSSGPENARAGGKRGFGKREADESELQKPLGKVSLFDYFGDILQDSDQATGNAAGGKKTSKETTPTDKNAPQRTRSDSAGRSEGNRTTTASSRNHTGTSGTNHHGSTGGGSRHHSDGNSHYAGGGGGGGVTNGGAGAKSYNQRFENNISSSFANRNTSSAAPGGGSGRDHRGRDQGGHYSGQSNREQQSSYKQADYYGSTGNSNTSGRYSRGSNENHSSTNHSTGASGGSGARSGGGSSRANDSKYNQQHQHPSSSSAGYGNSQQRSERTDGYHSNTNNNASATTTSSSSNSNNASGGGKYGGGGKGQSGNTAGYGNSYGFEGRNQQQQQQQQQQQHQQYGNDGRGQAGGGGGGGGSGKASGGVSASSNQQQGTSQHQQSSYGNGSGKQSNYNQQGPSGNANSQGHYGQQGTGGSNTGNSYGGGGGHSNSTKNATKTNRYGGKDESHKYSEGSTAPNGGTPSGATQNKKLPPKGHGSQTQPHSGSGSEQRANQHQQQPSYGPPSAGSGGKHPPQQMSNANAGGKVNQLADQLGSLQVSGSKSTGYAGGASGSHTNNTSSAAPSAGGKSGPMKQPMVPPNHPPTVVQHQQQHQQHHQPNQQPLQHAPTVASPPGAMPSTGSGGPSPGAPTNAGAGGPVTGGPGVPKNFIQLPNGYNYNPYQIMGFQNKQTNEFALNVLKSQQQFDPMAPPTHLGAPPAGPATVSPVGPGVGVGVGVPMAATGAPTGVLVPSPTLIAGGPPSAAVPMTAQLAMAPGVGPATMAVAYPTWKIGDRCLAKYWEDGGFYTAEITDTSKNTFVVHFLEYGNYEEVLKTDCIPISQSSTPGAPPAPMALGYHPASATAHMQPPQPAPGPPVQYAPHPAHPHHPPHPHVHHHGHVPPHHPPPPMAAGPPGAYPTASLPDYGPFKPGTPQMAQPMSAPGQPMNQYQAAPLHLHQAQQQQQPQQQPQQQQQQQHHHHQQQQQTQGHMQPHIHHHHQPMQAQPPQHHAQQQQQRSAGGKFREQRPMYVPPAQRK